MARTNTYTCKTCGTKFEFCLKCQFTRPDYDAENFCSHNHNDIYTILSKHGCNLITAEEALKELAAYNIDEITLTEDVLAHIEKIKTEANVQVEIPAETTVEEVSERPNVNTYKKNKNKKW